MNRTMSVASDMAMCTNNANRKPNWFSENQIGYFEKPNWFLKTVFCGE